jgi:hypothetical protein
VTSVTEIAESHTFPADQMYDLEHGPIHDQSGENQLLRFRKPRLLRGSE